MRLGVLLAVVCLLAGSAAAQDKPVKQKEADELFEQGRKLLNEAKDDKEKVKVACEKFDQAIKLDPEAPGTMLNLGLCNEKLEKYKTALYWFRKAQARAAETNLPDYEKAAKDHTVDLATNKVATIKITFSSPPPADTRVKIDGEDVASADYLRAEVDSGHHTLIAGAAGHKIVTQEFDVNGRGGDTLVIELLAGDNTVIVDRGKTRRTYAIYTAIGGGALLLTAGIISTYAMIQYNKCVAGNHQMIDDTKLGNDCPKSNTTDATLFANDYVHLAQRVGTGFFIAGSIATGIAAYLYFSAPAKERLDRTVFVPTVAPDQVGLAVSGGF